MNTTPAYDAMTLNIRVAATAAEIEHALTLLKKAMERQDYGPFGEIARNLSDASKELKAIAAATRNGATS